MASSSDDVPVLKISYRQLQERKRYKNEKYHKDRETEAHKPDSLPLRTVEVGTNWETTLSEWKCIDKRLDKLCSRWAGSSDHLEQVLTIW